MKLPDDIQTADAFLAIMRDLPDLYVFAKDGDGRFLLCNPALVKALGLSRENEILGKTDYDFFDRSLANRYRVEDQEVMQSAQAVTNPVWFVPGQDGHLRWYLASKYPLRKSDGSVAGIIGAMRDVSKTGLLLGPYQAMEPALTHMNTHFARALTVADLSGLVHLSVSQFERRFKQLFFATPMQYLNRLRLEQAARRLIESDAPIAIIALDCGFYDHSHFSKRFRSNYGESPRDFRRRQNVTGRGIF
jgi:PAS domain S-box-containing protein